MSAGPDQARGGDARRAFAAEAARPEAELDLARAALLVAAEEYPQLRAEPYLQRLEEMSERVRDRLADETAAPVILQELSRYLFEEEAFAGNARAYYDPRNSFLNDVLDRRLGIPLTLSMIYLEVGWRLGLPLQGVNFPGHFLVRYEGEALRLLVDPFHDGQVRFEDEAQTLLDGIYGGTVRLKPEYLRPADRKDMLVRLLANLKGIYLNARDEERALAAVERILLLRPERDVALREQGMLLVRTGRTDEALGVLRRYLEREPPAEDAATVERLLRKLREEG
ncbi:MAG: transglutaminase-like domain-containing protein [Gemmatimonadota bacterium]